MKPDVSATAFYQIKIPPVKAAFPFIMKLTCKALVVHSGVSVTGKFWLLEAGRVTSSLLLGGSRGVPGLKDALACLVCDPTALMLLKNCLHRCCCLSAGAIPKQKLQQRNSQDLLKAAGVALKFFLF